ncbi:MAG: methyltransferase domain-containing protein, partial [Pseudomonadota bacterium]
MGSDKEKAKHLLEGAYDLSTPGDHVRYYKDFADSYDQEFADALGYLAPKFLAKVFRDQSSSKDVPILDIGCGTGLVAQALNLDPSLVDGVDISKEMLEKSKAKNLYRHLLQVDLTENVDALTTDYGALLSAGTFTHGHLGPDVLKALLSVAKPDGLFCIGVNGDHYRQTDFALVIESMERDGLITQPQRHESKMYEKPATTHYACAT